MNRMHQNHPRSVLAAGTLLLDQVTVKGVSAFVQELMSQGSLQSLIEIPTGKSDLTDLGFLTTPPPPPSSIPPPIDKNPKVEGGIPGGVPGGVIGGLAGGVLGGQPPPPPPPPPSGKSTQPSEPIRVGSNVLISKLIKRVAPVYPQFADRAPVEGIVSLKIVVDKTEFRGQAR